MGFMVDGKKGYQSTMSNGYWKYLQRIDSNAPDFTYTASLSTETSKESEDTSTDITTKEENWGAAQGVLKCHEAMLGGAKTLDHCKSISSTQYNAVSKEIAYTTARETVSAVEMTYECSINLVC